MNPTFSRRSSLTPRSPVEKTDQNTNIFNFNTSTTNSSKIDASELTKTTESVTASPATSKTTPSDLIIITRAKSALLKREEETTKKQYISTTDISKSNKNNDTEVQINQTHIQSEVTKNTKMNQQQIQQTISSFIPEFDGTNRLNELDRFIGTANVTYDSMTSTTEKEIFNRLIQFRLTGDAYSRISNRSITDYPTLRDTLIHMYSKIETLEERERNLMTIQQHYGETVRNYGYRLAEALEKYKNGYRKKYQIENIDRTYTQHLITTAIQCFKRGLNNIILKEKIATLKSDKLEDIIDETETIEKMLMITTNSRIPELSTINQNQHNTTNMPTQTTIQPPGKTQPQLFNLRRPNLLICNFCQKPNHTWDVCRTRLNLENRNQPRHNSNQDIVTRQPYSTQFNRNYNNYKLNQQHFQPMNRTDNSQIPQQKFNSFSPTTHTRNYNTNQQTRFNTNNGYVPQEQNPGNYYRAPNQNTYANKPKYCSHCKTTTGHTFDECRSKFYANKNNNSNNYSRQQNPPDIRSLEEHLKEMKINMMDAQPPENKFRHHQSQEHLHNLQEHDVIYNQYHNQGNCNGSDQM